MTIKLSYKIILNKYMSKFLFISFLFYFTILNSKIIENEINHKHNFKDSFKINVNGVLLHRDTIFEKYLFKTKEINYRVLNEEFTPNISFEKNIDLEIFSFKNDSLRFEIFTYNFNDSIKIIVKEDRFGMFVSERPIFYLLNKEDYNKLTLIVYYNEKYKYIAEGLMKQITK
jgi:hypothetical protein